LLEYTWGGLPVLLQLPKRYDPAQAWPVVLAPSTRDDAFVVTGPPEAKELVHQLYPVALELGEKPRETTLSVTITGLRSTKGKVLLSLFSGPEGFPGGDKAVAVATAEIAEDKTAQHGFTGLVPATYALAFVHDENDNGKLDTGAFGIPKEGFGASRDPKVRLGPPRFKDAAVAITGSRAERFLTLKTTYL